MNIRAARRFPNDVRVFQSRIAFSVVLLLLAVAALVARLVYLQIVGHEHYATLSQDNRVKIAPLPPTRGVIFDRNGEVLADNVPSYSLELVPERIDDLDATLAELQTLLGLSDEDVRRFRKLRSQHKSFESIPLKMRLDEEQIARFAVKQPFFPGVQIAVRMIRTYPYAELTAHAVGYVSRISEADLKTLDPSLYSGTYHIGKSGIEKTYETLLHGRTGHQELETNVQGRSIGVLNTVPPIPGADLRLSLDITLQRAAVDALGDYNGAVVAMEPATGRVLAFVSKPSFDPNPFVYGIPKADYDRLQASPDRPLYNRALRGVYPPGSTVKPFEGLAGLEVGDLAADRKVSCPGYFQLPNSSHQYRDWRKGGHGAVDLKSAITQSCDVYFYKLALSLGIDKLSEFMGRFGFGTRTGIDIPGELPGVYPSKEWKKKRSKYPWFPGETVITGIGQGYVGVTPVQLARATAILANRGRVVTPRLLDGVQGGAGAAPEERRREELAIAPEHWDTVIQAMIDVVHSPRGTAKSIAGGLAYHIAGKTGTAQVFSVAQGQKYRESEVSKEMRDHALFIAFAPAEQPRIAVAVIAEHGGHGGSVAAPVARAVMERYLSGSAP
ncbi:penicillin-binding protein 2 [Methylococcus capsulatus]|jgi:penicillin-binding protein 2|uniref:Peptidoglycan D,D-transpeptidase MrdA n=1 Tax=Methylococcus capsulatus TaxID=414 RepID=A0AA35Y0A5_METCP|nr:penicillin-binding protein 2 [Methylococcus capsulatus]CAI8785323.1 peptidoglycan DD-transpeptidase MrdA [Methylococcus capsulatus]